MFLFASFQTTHHTPHTAALRRAAIDDDLAEGRGPRVTFRMARRESCQAEDHWQAEVRFAAVPSAAAGDG